MDDIYEISENPIYNPQIRKLKNSDPANADEIFNPLFTQINNNIHSLKIIIDALEDKGISLEALIEGLSAAARSGSCNDLTDKPESLPARRRR